MKRYLLTLTLLSILISCKSEKKQEVNNSVEVIETEYCEIIKSTVDSRQVLILFGGYGQSPEVIKQEFDVLGIANRNKVDLILMDYSQKLWLEEDDKIMLSELIRKTIKKHDLESKDIYIGGFSSGGVVSLHLSNYLLRNSKDQVFPKGVFIVDSPVDLLELSKSAKKNIERNFSDISVRESSWLNATLENKLGDPLSGISKYEEYSVYTSESNHIDNLSNLKNTQLRFYTEPDVDWWKDNRMIEYEELNAYQIKKLCGLLKSNGFKNVRYIPTVNNGYRADGSRHPHSWSIVNKEELFDWITAN